MGRIEQNKQRRVAGRPMVWFGVCAGSFFRMVRIHTNLDVIAVIEEDAP